MSVRFWQISQRAGLGADLQFHQPIEGTPLPFGFSPPAHLLVDPSQDEMRPAILWVEATGFQQFSDGQGGLPLTIEGLTNQVMGLGRIGFQLGGVPCIDFAFRNSGAFGPRQKLRQVEIALRVRFVMFLRDFESALVVVLR